MMARRFGTRLWLGLGVLSLMVHTPLWAKPHDHGPKHLGTFGLWDAFDMVEEGKHICFMTAKPEQSSGNYKKRGPVYLMVTHRPHDSYNVVSFHGGYPFAEDKDIHLKCSHKKGSESFSLFAKGETAWGADGTDDLIVRYLVRTAQSCVASGVSARGTKTSDTFSLKGSMAAYRAITAACRVPAKKGM